MYQVLRDLSFCFVYVDDILIFSQDLPSHVDHLHKVFRLCRNHWLTIGLPKSKFSVSKIEFLGHLLSANRCSPLDKHSAAISAFPLRLTSLLSRGSWACSTLQEISLRCSSSSCSSHRHSEEAWEVPCLVSYVELRLHQSQGSSLLCSGAGPSSL